jgi:hypothetical protein
MQRTGALVMQKVKARMIADGFYLWLDSTQAAVRSPPAHRHPLPVSTEPPERLSCLG